MYQKPVTCLEINMSNDCTLFLRSIVLINLIEKSEAHEYIHLIKTLVLPFTTGK